MFEQKARKDVQSGAGKDKRALAIQEQVDRQRMTIRVEKSTLDEGLRLAKENIKNYMSKRQQESVEKKDELSQREKNGLEKMIDRKKYRM